MIRAVLLTETKLFCGNTIALKGMILSMSLCNSFCYFGHRAKEQNWTSAVGWLEILPGLRMGTTVAVFQLDIKCFRVSGAFIMCVNCSIVL